MSGLLDTFPVILSALRKGECEMLDYTIRNVAGHVEVYDAGGAFCFSADTEHEALDELRALAA